MKRYNRREVISLLTASTLVGSTYLTVERQGRKNAGSLWAADGSSPDSSGQQPVQTVEASPLATLPRLGKLAARSSKVISASPLSVGFETLDRKMFQPERAYPRLAQLGVKWARVQTGWARCEPEKGRYDFAWLDAVVDQLLEIGIQPWFNLGYGNRLYTPEAKDASAVGWAPIFTEEAHTGWTQFVQALTKHFAKRVRHWEIWNEPNIATFWRPQKPNPKDYVELVKLTAPIIRQEVPQAVVIGGALAGMPIQYLQECLQAGLANYVDRLSFHPYGPTPEKNYTQRVEQFRKLLTQYRPGLALWQGECGCPSRRSDVSGWTLEKMSWTEERQAKWLLRRILSDLEQEVELASYFHTVDLLRYNWGEGPTNFDQSMGLLRGTDFSPKPSYFAYQSLCTLFDAETRRNQTVQMTAESSTPSTQKSGNPEIHIVGFERKGFLLAAYWTPMDLFQPWTTQSIRLRLTAKEKVKLANPVLIDPLHQDVYELPAPPQEQSSLLLADLPLYDFPWILTDEKALPGLETS